MSMAGESAGVVIGGASGLIGGQLTESFRREGVRVRPLVRPQSRTETGEEAIPWDPDRGELSAGLLENLQAVIHLGGESIASGYWTKARKAKIRESRVKATTFLSEKLASADHPPDVFLCASAIGFYGDRQDRWVDESADGGTGFLADLCREWEAAAEPAKRAGIRVVHLRIGVVLAREGGALDKMMTPFRLGLGGVVGKGTQYMSWIECGDLVRAIRFCLERETLSGPVNLVAPNPVTNREFTKTLGRVLGRPAVLPLPAAMVSLLMGEMGRELLLAGTRVRCKKLMDAGFAFDHPDLESALTGQLKKSG